MTPYLLCDILEGRLRNWYGLHTYVWIERGGTKFTHQLWFKYGDKGQFFLYCYELSNYLYYPICSYKTRSKFINKICEEIVELIGG